jgi:hypothetical protein
MIVRMTQDYNHGRIRLRKDQEVHVSNDLGENLILCGVATNLDKKRTDIQEYINKQLKESREAEGDTAVYINLPEAEEEPEEDLTNTNSNKDTEI